MNTSIGIKGRNIITAICTVGVLLSSIILLAFYIASIWTAKPLDITSAALVIRYYNPLSPVRETSMELDAAAANRLAGFFPGLGGRKTSRITGAWMPTVVVDFRNADGAVTNVMSDFEVWSEGRGDLPALPGLEQYIDELRRKTKGKSTSR